ncbi:ribbon-helix-helix domain-containing protein [Methanococcoides sp. FTZ1]
MVKISLHMPENDVADIEKLVERGDFMNVSDAIRSFTREKLAPIRRENIR